MSRVSLCEYFFFSSRRRHTRLQGDWSSDMCSSDLLDAGAYAHEASADGGYRLMLELDRRGSLRSEERRVGKECRARWGTDERKKKRRKMRRQGAQKLMNITLQGTCTKFKERHEESS